VGRRDELARIDALLTSTGEERPTILHVHGPGGVGKSALLRACQVLVSDRDRRCVLVDGADTSPTVPAFLEQLRRAAGADPAASIQDALGDGVLLIDHFEALEPLQAWWWHTFLPELPEESLVIVSGRRSAPPSWRRDPAWSELVEVMPLRNLPPDDARTLLHARGLPPGMDVSDIVRATHGHPLALTIAADRYVEGGGDTAPRALVDHPDAAARLIMSFVDEVAEPRQRDALHVSAHARRVDRALLREVLDLDDLVADELLAWLRERPYSESHADGLALHDVVRDALDRDLRWRDHEAFIDLHRRIRAVVVRRMKHAADAGTHQRAAHDLLHLHRTNRDAEDTLRFEDGLGAYTTRPVRPPDREAVIDLCRRVEGPVRGLAMDRWLSACPEGFTLIESASGDLAGCLATVRLDRPTDCVDDDPLVLRVRAELDALRPPEPGEVVLLQVAANGEHPERLGGASNEVAALSLRSWSAPGLGWVVLASTHEEVWEPVWSYIGFERLGGLTVADGSEVGIWGRDFRRSDFADWLDSLAPQEVAESADPLPADTTVALSHADFVDAVRQLLRDLHRTDRVIANPLMASHLARHRSGARSPVAPPGDVAAGLVEVVREALVHLTRDSHAANGVRALDRTFFRAAPSQERAAEVLGLPFSTYRRHLRQGVEDLTSLLWSWELHGPPRPDHPSPTANGQEVSSRRPVT